jgi:hypothetical protein
MSSEHTEEFSEPRVNRNPPMSDDGRANQTTGNGAPSDNASPGRATRPEVAATHRDPARNEPADETVRDSDPKSAPKEVSEAKVRLQSRLPALDDDADVGVQKEQLVTRDGKADLAFTGVLLASAAPDSAPKGHWQEYRIYQTSGGKHVFSRVTRTVFAEENDTHEAEVFDPAPSSVPSQLLRSAREIARSRPLTWMDAAVAFFGYDPLAKVLYRKLSVRFEEQIS